MIARVWHGATAARKAQAYLEYLTRTGVRECLRTAGNRGVHVLFRVREGRADFLFISFWDSLESIRRFAGSDVDKAVYYPEDRAFLMELEPTVVHYEFVTFDTSAVTS